MADDTSDYSEILGETSGGPLEKAFQPYDAAHTTNDMFTTPGSFIGTVTKAAKSAVSSKPVLQAPRNDYGFGTLAVQGNFRRGDTGSVGLEATKPPSRTRPAQSEDPRAIWHQWYSDMKSFGYNNK